MKHLLRTSVLLILAGLITTLGASTIIATFGGIACTGTGQAGLCSARPGAFTVDFGDGFNAGSPYTSGVATYTWQAPLSPIVKGSVSGAYAAPGQDANPTSYLSVGSPDGPATVTINLSRPIFYFGLYV